MFSEVLQELLRARPTRETPTRKFQVLSEPVSLRACFVDGGNAPVFESPEARVEFVRLYGTVYDGKERIRTKRKEGILLLRYGQDGEAHAGETSQEVITVKSTMQSTVKNGAPLNFGLTLSADDPELRFGRERVSLATAASLARFLLECSFLQLLGADCALLVRDGSLVPNNGHEARALKELFTTGKLVAGLSKTNTLLTSDGLGAGAAALAEGPERPWLSPVKEEEGIAVSIVRLHAKSRYAFRLDTNGQSELIARALLSLSGDAAFPGYPYPLIEADRMARVTNHELAEFRLRFRAEAGDSWHTLERGARSLDAHDVLDTM